MKDAAREGMYIAVGIMISLAIVFVTRRPPPPKSGPNLSALK